MNNITQLHDNDSPFVLFIFKHDGNRNIDYSNIFSDPYVHKKGAQIDYCGERYIHINYYTDTLVTSAHDGINMLRHLKRSRLILDHIEVFDNPYNLPIDDYNLSKLLQHRYREVSSIIPGKDRFLFGFGLLMLSLIASTIGYDIHGYIKFMQPYVIIPLMLTVFISSYLIIDGIPYTE